MEGFRDFYWDAEHIGSINYIGDFAFGILSGSYFADWNATKDGVGGIPPNNILKSCLAQQAFGLAVMWDLTQHSGPWVFPTQPLGDVLASALRSLLNTTGQSVRSTFILGDPDRCYSVHFWKSHFSI